MSLYIVEQSAPFEANVETGITGLVGILEVVVIDNDGNTITGPTTANITENVVGGVPTGNYSWNNPAAPAVIGQYQVLWSNDGLFDPETVSSDDLVVITSTSDAPLPPIPAPVDGGLSSGPCTAWTDGDAVLVCCGEEVSSGAVFDEEVDQASQLLFELSGRKFSGLCSITARPPCDCSCWGFQRLAYASGGSRYLWTGSYWNWNGSPFGCCGVSRVKLSGYPIREITEVKIDGDVVAADEYRLDEYRYLTRMNDGRWPACQNMSLPDTEEGTFSISYTYGQSPPLDGQAAAAELACELYKACTASLAASCALPKGTTRVTRQGITIERLAFTSWGFREGRWQTGMPQVDTFLNAYNAAGLMRRPTFWAPGRRYARPVT